MLLKDFYSVISTFKKDDLFLTEICINKSHPLYKGHFPNRPVTPGVILMQLFKEEAERQVGCKLQLVSATNVKFTAVVDPNVNDVFQLESTIENENGLIKLKGIGKNNDAISLKISSLYKKI